MRTDRAHSNVYYVGGSLLNEVANAVNSLAVITAGTEQLRGLFHGDRLRPVTIIGVAQVTDASDECPPSDGPGDEFDPPCFTSNLYRAQFIYWDSGERTWQRDAAGALDLDASSLYECRQGLFKGEKVNVYYDPLAARLVPIFPAPATYLLLLLEDLEASDGDTATQARANVYVRNCLSNAFDFALDHDGEKIEVIVYSWYTSQVDKDEKILANRDAFGDLWMSSVDCPP